MTFPLSVLSFSALLALPVAAQQTWTVDDDQPADFGVLQDAIDFASDGGEAGSLPSGRVGRPGSGTSGRRRGAGDAGEQHADDDVNMPEPAR